MGRWSDEARWAITEAHRALPPGASLDERTKAIDAAYPFGQRAYFPYKAWLKVRREYLCRYGYEPKGKPLQESPLERMMRRAAK